MRLDASQYGNGPSRSIRRGSLLALRLLDRRAARASYHSMRDRRTHITHAAFALGSETLHAPSQYYIKWMKWCFWLILRLLPRKLSSRRIVLVLCCLFCFFVTSLWRWSVYIRYCRLFTVSTRCILIYLCTVQLIYVTKRSRRELHLVGRRSSVCNRNRFYVRTSILGQSSSLLGPLFTCINDPPSLVDFSTTVWIRQLHKHLASGFTNTSLNYLTT